MIVTVLKGGYRKKGLIISVQRTAGRIFAIRFRLNCMMTYGALDAVVTNTLDKHAPLKKKYLRANDGPFMTMAL